MRADVTVGSFLSGGIDSTAIAALAKRYNPNLLTFTTGFEREGFSEIDVAAESAAAIGVEHITKVVTAGGVRRRHPAGGLVPRRPGRRPGARAAVLHRPRGPQARQGRALRRGRRRAVRRLQHLPRAAVAWRRSTKLPAGVRRALGKLSPALPDGMRGKDLLRRGSIPLEQRYYGNARIFRDDELGFLERRDPDLSHVTVTARAVRAHPGGRLRRRHRHAVRRPVHLAARRHPGQGRQDDDGELAGTAGAVPRPRGVQGRRARCRSTSG